jgi:hypothetical protein
MVEGKMNSGIGKNITICAYAGTWLSNDTDPTFLKLLDIQSSVHVSLEDSRLLLLLIILNMLLHICGQTI